MLRQGNHKRIVGGDFDAAVKYGYIVESRYIFNLDGRVVLCQIMTAVGEINRRSEAFVKLPQPEAAMKVSGK